MFKRGYILRGRVDFGRASYRCLKGGIFWKDTSQNNEKGGGVDPRRRGRFNYTQFDLDENVDLYPKLHTHRLELDSLL